MFGRKIHISIFGLHMCNWSSGQHFMPLALQNILGGMTVSETIFGKLIGDSALSDKGWFTTSTKGCLEG